MPQAIFLLVAVAAIAAVCGHTASAIARRKKQRARRYLTVGFLCGFAAGVIVRRNWRDIAHLVGRALSSRSSRLARQPHRALRLPLALLPVRR
ncbi:hypothetical protein [Mycolicibacterium gadium]|uniref:Uncharacterized protein n=1 Tax=Mycolicibacterium gadium TaxID=1794 RepID=A0ABT6GVJ9_MYCGU|nr:hypothetical protein [Mycolicibacterium gadium]MDG5485373.1 hypothetical protein [Mycolicibacterium gadium]